MKPNPTNKFLGAAILVVVAVLSAVGEDAVFHYDVDLELNGALLLGETTNGPMESKDLSLTFGYVDGQWDKWVGGWAGVRRRFGTEGDVDQSRLFNQMDHDGRIVRVSEDDGKIDLSVAMSINSDFWVKGGTATYHIVMHRENQCLNGTFTGTFNGHSVTGGVQGVMRRDLWPSPVKDWKPLEPAEHPRMIFRRGDLPALRERAKTPEGKAIIARLRLLLGGGEEMPTQYQTATGPYGPGLRDPPVGTYTIAHGMGFGMLYQLTGEKKYADLARKCVDKAVVEKIRDRDQRYSWDRPGGRLRAGYSYAMIAMAYDLCYDAWDEAYRRNLAAKIQEKIWWSKPFPVSGEKTPPDTPRPEVPNGSSTPDDTADAVEDERTDERAQLEPVHFDMILNTRSGQHSPRSNHYGAWIGGAGTTILGILGDPGTDQAICERAHRISMYRLKRALVMGGGYSSKAYFYEGTHCGRISANTGLMFYLNTLRVAAGRDYVENCSTAQWLLTKWLYAVNRVDDTLPCRHERMYARTEFLRTGRTDGTDFAQGFGIVPERQKPAALWFYNHVICPGEAKDYDAIMWPDSAVYAFVNWPIGVKEQNPADVMPKYLCDPDVPYFVFRSGWGESDGDVVTYVYRTQSIMAGRDFPPLNTRLSGGGRTFTGPSRMDAFTNLENGAACLIRTGDQVFLADMSGVSGAKVLFVRISDVPIGSMPADTARESTEARGVPDAFKRFKRRPEAQVGPGPGREKGGEFAPIASVDRAVGDKTLFYQTKVVVWGRKHVVTFAYKGHMPETRAVDGRVPGSQMLAVGRRTIAVEGANVIVGTRDQP